MSPTRRVPGGSVEAVVYAVVNLFWAAAAIASVVCRMPLIIPGGNPVIALPGDMSTSPLTTLAPTALVMAEPAKIPVPQSSGAIAMGAGQAVVAVVNIHTKACASPLPNWSCAPVVIVAVYWVFTTSGFMGVGCNRIR